MKKIKGAIKLLIGTAAVVAIAIFVVTNYGWVFSKVVRGEILNVERVTDPQAIITSRVTQEQLHSYSILIQSDDGKLYAASSEDRQWQVAKKGFCVEARLYRYPPWRLSLANTFYNARILELSRCPGKPLTDEPEPSQPADAEKATPPAVLPMPSDGSAK